MNTVYGTFVWLLHYPSLNKYLHYFECYVKLSIIICKYGSVFVLHSKSQDNTFSLPKAKYK